MKNMPGQGHDKDKDHDKNKTKGKEKADTPPEHKAVEQLHQRGEKLQGLAGRMARIAELSRELEKNAKALNAKKATQNDHSKEPSPERSKTPPRNPMVELKTSAKGKGDEARKTQAEENIQNLRRGAEALQKSLHDQNQHEKKQQQQKLRQQTDDIERVNRMKLAMIDEAKLNDRKIHEFSRIINIGIKSIQSVAMTLPTSPDVTRTLDTLVYIQQKTADQVAACISSIPRKSGFFQASGALPKDAWKNFLTALIEILNTAKINDPKLESNKNFNGIYEQVQQELRNTARPLQDSAVTLLLPPPTPPAAKK